MELWSKKLTQVTDQDKLHWVLGRRKPGKASCHLTKTRQTKIFGAHLNALDP